MISLFALLMTGPDERWHPGIGDPTPVGYLTVVAYLLAAGLCVAAARAARVPLLTRFWLGLGFVMLLLGINKQLDLQTLFTEVLRDLALSQGWYEERRPLQLAFVITVVCAGIGSGLLLGVLYRAVLAELALAIAGVCVLASFVVIRAASFHHVSLWLATGRVRMNWVLELSGIAIVAVAAYRAQHGPPRASP